MLHRYSLQHATAHVKLSHRSQEACSCTACKSPKPTFPELHNLQLCLQLWCLHATLVLITSELVMSHAQPDEAVFDNQRMHQANTQTPILMRYWL